MGQKDEGAELKGGEDGQWGCEPLEVGLLRMAFTLRSEGLLLRVEVLRLWVPAKEFPQQLVVLVLLQPLRLRLLPPFYCRPPIQNSFFLTVLSWLRKLNSAAFFWSLANLF